MNMSYESLKTYYPYCIYIHKGFLRPFLLLSPMDYYTHKKSSVNDSFRLFLYCGI